MITLDRSSDQGAMFEEHDRGPIDKFLYLNLRLMGLYLFLYKYVKWLRWSLVGANSDPTAMICVEFHDSYNFCKGQVF